MNLFKASRQWAERPPDERFSSIAEMKKVCKEYADTAVVSEVPSSDLRVEAVQGEVKLVGRTGQPARFTNYGFKVLCQKAGAPTDYLQNTIADAPTLVCQNLNHGLRKYGERMDILKKEHRSGYKNEDAMLLFHRNNGEMLLRAFTSQWYSRIWNYQVCEWLEQLPSVWRVPPARPARIDQPGARRATAEDILSDREGGGGLSVKIGDMIAPAGLYASDHDMFAFLVNESLNIKDGSSGGLSRGFFVENSEVGASAFKLTMFLYRHVCGNHIVWGAAHVTKTSVVHVGDKAHGKAEKQLRTVAAEYCESSGHEQEEKIKRAQAFILGRGQDEVVDALFKLRITSRKNLEAAYVSTDGYCGDDGDPRTPWGMAQGLSRISQQATYANDRVQLDAAAGALLQVAF